MTTRYKSADALNVPATDAQCSQLIAAWLDRAGYAADVIPCDRETAASILAIGGQYAVDADEMERLTALGMMPDIGQYDARDLIACAAALEGRRQWEHPSVHSPKMHYTARILAEARAEGGDAVAALRTGIGNTDLTMTLLLMTECDNREMREQLLSTVRLLLETEHGVTI